MESPLVSVIIPIYNTEAFLERCINSVVNQTYKHLEILLIDDGSTDTSPAICDEYAENDERVKVFHKGNEGLSSTRNLGIQKATGKYIYFLDSDDFIASDAFEILCKEVERDDLDFLSFEPITVNEQDQRIKDEHAPRRNQEKYSMIMDGKSLYTILFNCQEYRVMVPVLFIKKEFLLDFKMSFYPGILHEDELFVFLIYMYARRAKHISKALFYRRIREGSIMTSAKSERNFIGRGTALKKMLEYSDQVTDSSVKNAIIRHASISFLSTMALYERISIAEKRKNAKFKNDLIDGVKKRYYLYSKKVRLAACSMKFYLLISGAYHFFTDRIRHGADSKGGD